MVTDQRGKVEKFAFSNLILCLPTTIEEVSYRPSLLVVRCLTTPVSRLVTVTLTSGIRAPLASVAVPRMSPELVFCAIATLFKLANANRATEKVTLKYFPILPPIPFRASVMAARLQNEDKRLFSFT